jgi:hypothetical protein
MAMFRTNSGVFASAISITSNNVLILMQTEQSRLCCKIILW